MENLVLTLLIYCALGIGAGFISGLLGAGGGLVIVPGLMWLFHYEPVNMAIAMHIAVGTSLATMIPVSFRSLTSHTKRNVIFFPIYKRLAPSIIVGVIAGSILAYFIHSDVLKMIFGGFVFFMACVLLWNARRKVASENLPGMLGMSSVGAFVGLQSGMLGIAGSAFSVPFLTHRGVSIRVAVVVSMAIAVTVSMIGTTIFVITGWHEPNMPSHCLGYVYLPAWIGLTIGGVFIAPIGAKVSHLIPAHILKIFFACFLFLVSAQMLR